MLLLAFEIKQAAQELFDTYTSPESEVRSLAGLVKYNEEHPSLCMPKGKLPPIYV
jgi:hypothetical protein